MATSLTFPNVNFRANQQVVRTISTVPLNALGFSLRFQKNSSWDVQGRLFDLLVEISPDNGVNWHVWVTGGTDGAPLTVGKDGTTDMSISATWPGILAEDGVSREELKQTDVRFTVTPARDFSSPLVTLSALLP